MTPEKINAALAESCGWRKNPDRRFVLNEWLHDERSGEPPNYFGDLNALHEAEKKLTPGESSYYAGELRKALGFHQHTYFDLLHATAPQRCEAVLKTLGKWETS